MNSSYELRKAALIEEITQAFDGVSRENGVSLSESWVIDDYGSDEERAEARRKDTETRWQDVPDEDIGFGYSCLNFLDEIGFHYYIPAFVVWFLRHVDNEDPDGPGFNSMTFEWLIYALGSSSSGPLDDFALARFRMFSPAQCKAIAHFLEFEGEREEASRIECEQWRQASLIAEGFSQEEIDALWQEGEKHRIASDLPENDARRALERYWGQFK
jgi:hypothetical protein